MDRIQLIINNDEFKKNMTLIKKAEENREFCRHGIEHSFDTARIGYIINLEEGYGISKEIIYAAALLHDIGRYYQYTKGESHHQAGALIARRILTDCQFSYSETEEIYDAILAHKVLEQEEKGTLKAILYKADKLSRNCFQCDAIKLCYWEDNKKNMEVIY